MKIKNVYCAAVLIAMATMLTPAMLVWAGTEGGSPPDWDKVTGPEVWATAVVRCEPGNTNFIAIRVKRIKDCIVKTQALVLYPLTLANACPDNSNPFLYERLEPGSIFPNDEDIPQTFKPIVTIIKNFKVDTYENTGTTATLSFDAQIKFVDEGTP
jgi:hypothetical protein